MNSKVIISLLEGILRVLSRKLYKWRERAVDSSFVGEYSRDRSLSVVVTTHSRRFFSGALPLIKSLRASSSFDDLPIYLVINADTFGDFDFELRSRFLAEACALGNVFPVCFGEPAGMSELWNAGIESAGTEKILVLSDDLTILEPGLAELRRKVSSSLDHDPVIVINGSWGHFAISRTAIKEVGWFEDRLLGFGDEDGDYTHRYREVFSKDPGQVDVFGVNNVSSTTGFEEIVKGPGKYSLFNRSLITLKYGDVDWDGFGAYSGLNARVGQHPGRGSWEFKQRFRHLLSEKDGGVIQQELADYFNQSGK